jgi:inner membrane protein
MTPIGHSLTGAALAVLVTPNAASNRDRALVMGVCVLAANSPDLSLPGWGHDQYLVSHSVFVNAAIMAVAAWLSMRLAHRTSFPVAAMVLGGALALFSHLLLDSFYNHGLGIALLWPFSDARLALPVPWFETWESVPPPWNSHTFRVAAIEFLFYFPLLIFCLEGRRVSDLQS